MATNPNQISIFVYDKLRTYSGVTRHTNRISPEVIDEASTKFPYIVYGIRNNQPTNTKSGTSRMDTVTELSDACRQALDYRDDLPEGISKLYFQTEGYEYDDDFKSNGVYVLTQQFIAKIRR
jgi:hypothetical protein